MASSPVATSWRLEGVVPHFRVPDVVRTAEYYRDVLGFEIAGYWDGESVHDDPGRAVVFGIVRRDEVSVHFNRADSADGVPRSEDGAYDVYFDVTSVDALARDLRGRGADVVDGPADRPYGRRELVVRDLDGRLIAFAEQA